jgi:hypothetical protein
VKIEANICRLFSQKLVGFFDLEEQEELKALEEHKCYLLAIEETT